MTKTGPKPRPPIDRFNAKIRHADNGCIEWIGGPYRNGYGQFSAAGHAGKKILAHRFSFEHHVGPIPEGLELDHLCRNRACVNPAHLEPVTRQENIRRAAAHLTHCPSGHEYTEANTYVRPGTVHRSCRQCSYDRDLKRRDDRNAKRRAERLERGHNPKGPALKSECKRGHPLSGENIYTPPNSTARHCRECKRLRASTSKEQS